jgi:hypothetical protein
MEILDDWPEQIRERFVSFFISCHYSDRVSRVLNSTLDTDLNITSLIGVLFLHIGPNFSSQVLLE